MIIYFDCAAVDKQIIDMLIIININTILIIIKINSFNVIMNDVINFEKYFFILTLCISWEYQVAFFGKMPSK